jgi:phosphatidate phosphatase APP1
MQTTDHTEAAMERSWKEKLLNLFRLTARPTLKVYHGYGHENNLTIFGHVFRLSPFPRKQYRQSFLRNTLALLRLFLIKPFAGVKVQLEWKGKKYTATTDTDGFFKFDWCDTEPFEKGWLPVGLKVLHNNELITTSVGRIYIPHPTQYVIVSDIDDTFLVSHSANIRKRLLVLFTQNARSRKPFEGVVRHYQLLAKSNTTDEQPNPFFYVSSSEWNLYEYILEFTAVNKIPRGIFLLSQLKVFSELLKTGQNNHGTKFARIVRIMEAFPKQRVILLGDSSQQDPYIYESITRHFPKQVHAVYIRDVFQRNYQKVSEVLNKIEAKGIPCCLFKDSKDAILHSVKIGLISPADAEEKLSVPKEEAIKMA